MKATMELKIILQMIKQADELQKYEWRNEFIYSAVYLAVASGLPAGFRIDPQEPEWPVAFIELPTGQVSWHVPQHTTPWDKHTTEEKYARIKAFVEVG